MIGSQVEYKLIGGETGGAGIFDLMTSNTSSQLMCPCTATSVLHRHTVHTGILYRHLHFTSLNCAHQEQAGILYRTTLDTLWTARYCSMLARSSQGSYTQYYIAFCLLCCTFLLSFSPPFKIRQGPKHHREWIDLSVPDKCGFTKKLNPWSNF